MFAQIIKVLSGREKQVLQLITREYNDREIAHALNISKSTIATYRNNIRTKLGARNMAGVVRNAFELGILHLNEQNRLILAE